MVSLYSLGYTVDVRLLSGASLTVSFLMLDLEYDELTIIDVFWIDVTWDAPEAEIDEMVLRDHLELSLAFNALLAADSTGRLGTSSMVEYRNRSAKSTIVTFLCFIPDNFCSAS
jgi:hypothetical protein